MIAIVHGSCTTLSDVEDAATLFINHGEKDNESSQVHWEILLTVTVFYFVEAWRVVLAIRGRAFNSAVATRPTGGLPAVLAVYGILRYNLLRPALAAVVPTSVLVVSLHWSRWR